MCIVCCRMLDNNRLCSYQACQAQMSKDNNAIFLIKEEVINMMISTSCVSYTVKPPTLITDFSLSLLMSAMMYIFG